MTPALTDILALAAAIPLAAIGGEAFLKGVLSAAVWLRVPKFLVATTLAAFATSAPELTVSTLAALSGKPEIGLGDALGSNVVNLGLILGLALLLGGIAATLGEIRRDFGLAMAAPLIGLAMAADGRFSRIEGVLLLILFLAWLSLAIRQGLAHRRDNSLEPADLVRPGQAGLFLALGLAALVLAGRLFVTGATGIAVSLGVHAYVIGAVLVAIGTSLPELITTLLARLRGHDEIGLGTLLGSNLFNGLAIVGTAAVIHPIAVPFANVGLALGCGILTLVLILPRQGFISRRRGLALIAVYLGFSLATIGSGGG